MSGKEQSDYSDFDNTWVYRGRPLAKQQRKELISSINPSVCHVHGISAEKEHEALLFNLVRIMNTGSEVSMLNGEISPPKDQPTIKEARKKIKKAADKLSAAHEMIHDFIGDETVRALLERSDGWEDISVLLPVLGRVATLLDEAANYKGNQGARRNPDWIKNFCDECNNFWKLHMPGGTSLVYQNEQESPVSEWVYHLFKELGEFTELNPKDSVLFTHAKRPNR
ncbi:hypothetical protein [Lentilitoribacter sp. Alg239-R112]|uniref:hypothetical protein n=1 Tax=Lentilitoribacter sp. Alg239-R112 TaxID=2305987 RepID=UPI0013A6BD94|nr:hypothetical protein [Lentilitoribacter sp. Alg239-R112]